MSDTAMPTSEQFEEIIQNAVKEMGLSQEQQDLAGQMTGLLSSGGTLDQVYDLSDQDKEVIYAIAHNYYTSGKYEKAIPLFQFLSLVDHVTKKWWMGLGAATQMAGEFDKAVNAYGMATLLDVDDPQPQLQAAYCLLMMKKNDEARSALEGVVMVTEANSEHQDLNAQAKAMLANLNDPGKGA